MGIYSDRNPDHVDAINIMTKLAAKTCDQLFPLAEMLAMLLDQAKSPLDDIGFAVVLVTKNPEKDPRNATLIAVSNGLSCVPGTEPRTPTALEATEDLLKTLQTAIDIGDRTLLELRKVTL